MINLSSGEYFGNSLDVLENDDIKLCITEYSEEDDIGVHDHQNAYLSLLFSGSYLEQSSNTVQRVEAGEALFRPQGYKHKNTFETVHGKCFNIEFKPSWFNLKGSTQIPLTSLKKFKVVGHPSLYKLLVLLKKGVHDMDLATEYVYDWYGGLAHEYFPKADLRWIKAITIIVNDEKEVFHSLQSLSERVYVHPVYLARAFKKRMGCTIGEYQLQVKMDHAMKQLLKDSKTIGEISFETGFYDDPHFIRSFKSYYGLPPSQFKKTITG
ncbi:helix-turn-helix domain-containing protein [Flagellimonas flava]|uniref:AraC-type DNA-binding protein n=1 Tax=Flagellimonas flava TaxID=570519 RepID=A0A1M5J1J6_9FLAO|nr:AraC family transcriptional regulator [Allomuricauda flava]SHG34100.1 AraC-type DNA-binding protein [Allomuricauda flava]